MIYRNLGNSGLKVSVIGFGNWVTGHDPNALKTQTEILQYAWE
jgi:aryl-alcohol dehydrogenase-like predicted oxidoreductase